MMSSIVLLDTSVYLNILGVPSYDQHAAEVGEKIVDSAEKNYLFLPVVVILETGNHIAHLSTGQARRRNAKRFVTDVRKAIAGTAPYQATYFPKREEFLTWLAEFPDRAMRSKSAKKQGEGMSLADLAILKEWERDCKLYPLSRVRIWSLDGHLSGYDSQPAKTH